MSYSNYPPFDPARYYGQPPPPSAYPPQNGYPAPQSPSQPPPARPHTTAPYPSPSQYAPPTAAYYGAAPPAPPANGHPPPAHPPVPPAPAPPASGYPPQPPIAPPAPAAPYTDVDKMSPEQLQGMIEQLQTLKMSKSPAPRPLTQAPGPNGHPAHSPPPRINTSMPPPPAHHEPPQSARAHHATPSLSGGYPPYPYHYKGPASHSGDISPAPTGAPAYPSKPAASMPGGFFSEGPVPPVAPAPPPKTPGPHRHDVPRKAPEQSEMSFSSSNKSHELEKLENAWNQWGGPLVDTPAEREPRPKPKLVSLYRGIAAYMIALLEPPGSCVVTLGKLMQFYNTFSVGEAEATNWQRFFNHRSPKLLSDLFCVLNVEHHLVPTKPNQTPSIPGLTPRGFEVWMFTQLMTDPSREWARLSKVLDRWTIFDQGVEMPKMIPRECFPLSEDRAIYTGWWKAVHNEYPEEADESDEERKVPLSLPEPPEKGNRGRSYSNLRGGDLPLDAHEDDYRDSPPPGGPPPLPQAGRIPRKLHPKVPDSHEFPPAEEREEEPLVERHRPYGGAAPNPNWREDPRRREDVNPRPVLGEEPRPPGRSRSMRRPATGKEPSRRLTKRGRSQHRAAQRDDSPEGRCSDEDYEEPKYDGYGKRYEGDGLYETLHIIGYGATPSRAPKQVAAADSWALSRYEEPPSHTTSGPGPQFRREQSRGPPKSRPPPHAEKDISEYMYQDQYEKDSAGRRPHRGSDAAHGPYSGRGGRPGNGQSSRRYAQ